MSELQFDTYTKEKNKKTIPNAVYMAKKLISDNPELFKDCFDTYFKMAELMHRYADKCNEYSNLDFSISEIRKELTNLTRTINP